MKSVFKDIIEHLLALHSRVLHIALGDEKGRSLERFIVGQVLCPTRIYHRNYLSSASPLVTNLCR